ncbi:hypothetical protein FTO70_08405 [Methanosarcina sp. KYL-1]|uniref:hypothetical protein n=1 Tax=Methanosarcina sp. KYL-1 TaxID=2602068 RepID=UPI002101BF51|nr:hypothetical protein [Methanosarcina sp. KYL-1]MCQ1535700.1 hypothetical protein [Methanosarcina sp. KYL-1]
MRAGLKNRWYVSEGGFWRSGKHLVLEEGVDYPENDTWMDQYIVADEDGTVKTYRPGCMTIPSRHKLGA